MRSFSLLTLAVSLLLCVTVAPAGAAIGPDQKCASTKRRLAGKEIAALTKCDGRAVAMGAAADTTCETRAMTAFANGWANAEAKGDCAITGDATAVDNMVDSHRADLQSSLMVSGSTPSKCTAAKFGAAGNQGKCKLGCTAQAALRDLPLTDPTVERCLSICRAKFVAGFAGAERKADCRTTGDAGSIESQIDEFVAQVVDVVPAKNPCPSGQTLCSGACVDTSTDPNNCGFCGQLCPTGSGFECAAGACGCPAGETVCGTRCESRPCYCANTQSELSNCGACGRVCFNPTGGPAACSEGCCLTDGGDGTIHDGCTGLQWEKKTGTVGDVPNPSDLHDVNNTYNWTGCCNGSCTSMFLCQPEAASGTSCATLSDGGTLGCSTNCGSSTCFIGPNAITTIWDWINQLNASNLAGHSDWRIPSEGGNNFPPTGSNELETILVTPCVSSPCIDPIFGPTRPSVYWSSSTTSLQSSARFVDFSNGSVQGAHKYFGYSVRALRGP